MGTTEQKSQCRQQHGRGRRAEVAPAAIDALGKPGLPGWKPFADHADPDHKTGADKAQQEAGEGKLFEILGQGEGKTDEAGTDEDRTEHQPGSAAIHQHARNDARWNGQGHVQNQQDANLLIRQAEILP